MKTKELQCLFPVTWNEVSAAWFKIGLEGLDNRGRELDGSRANAALLLGRILFRLEEQLDYVLSEMESGSPEEVVPEQGTLLVGIAEEDEPLLSVVLGEMENRLREEYRSCRDRVAVTMERVEDRVLPGLHPIDLQKAVFYLVQLPDGVQKTGGNSGNQPEVFCCLQEAELRPDGLYYRIRTGSCTESAGDMLTDKISYLTEFLGGETGIN